MKKSIPTILALLITAALFCMLFAQESPDHSAQQAIIRVWLINTEQNSAAFLRKCAAAYERQTGQRIYLRSATQAEGNGAIAQAAHIVPPDLIIGVNEGEKILCQGYALVFRDDSMPVFTPAPTSLLFSPPTPTPGPSPTPAPTRQLSSYADILCPRDIAAFFPGSIASDHPAQDLTAGKGGAALLTARQASALTIGWQGQVLPDNAGIKPLYAQSLSAQGSAFLAFLQNAQSQERLREYGFYSPFFPLYVHENSLQGSIDRSIPR